MPATADELSKKKVARTVLGIMHRWGCMPDLLYVFESGRYAWGCDPMANLTTHTDPRSRGSMQVYA
ncbi:hypothetical protein NDU88_005984, partial [Pleurodeles waltl]